MSLMSLATDAREWLEADGLGGFAFGTVCGIRTRRYHALLLVATTPPTGRVVLVNGLEVWVETPSGTCALSSQRYATDVVHPDGAQRLRQFTDDPWPRWVWALPDGTQVEQSVFVPHERPLAVITWRRLTGAGPIALRARPLLSGRDYHALHRENPAFRFEATVKGEQVRWRPYDSLPEIVASSNGTYHHEPVWYRNVQYDEERARGLDCVEDLASPGIFRWSLKRGKAVLAFAADQMPEAVGRLRTKEQRRRHRFASRLERSADAYLVRRGSGRTIIAGYPWFTDWGRDTFIALRGLCLATGRLKEARQILIAWAGTISQGMVPNRFPDERGSPEYNSVDASLWYIIAVDEYFRAMRGLGHPIATRDQQMFRRAINAILAAYAEGTRFGIRMDRDGLLAAGESGTPLTWMDVKIGDWAVTPRIGKPVEVEALWLNALWIGSAFSERWEPLFLRGRDTFRARFWNAPGGYLYDVIDVNHQPGAVDASFRPNQIFAVGGLPLTLINGAQTLRIVEQVEQRLWTPMGLRSLAPGEPGYAPQYEGGVRERDAAYHQGTVWPWLMGAFVEAWLHVQGNTPEARERARRQFIEPLLRHLDEAGLGHISEIADAEPPHTPRGCPFQAWSLGEVLRLLHLVSVDRRLLAEAGTR